MNAMSMAPRLTDVEEKLLHLEKLVDELNQVIRELGDQGVRQQRQITLLQNEARKLAQSSEPDTPDERPPHW